MWCYLHKHFLRDGPLTATVVQLTSASDGQFRWLTMGKIDPSPWTILLEIGYTGVGLPRWALMTTLEGRILLSPAEVAIYRDWAANYGPVLRVPPGQSFRSLLLGIPGWEIEA